MGDKKSIAGKVASAVADDLSSTPALDQDSHGALDSNRNALDIATPRPPDTIHAVKTALSLNDFKTASLAHPMADDPDLPKYVGSGVHNSMKIVRH